MKQSVLLLAHGTPESAEQVPEYLKWVTNGRPLPQEVIDEISHRYALIGHSPLTDLTIAQARALEKKLNVPVYVGMRNWHPFIADTVAKMLSESVTNALVICLAPQNSRTSVGLYKKAVMAAAGDKLALEFIESWHARPKLITAFADKLRAVRHRKQRVIFTAHSVPLRTVVPGEQEGDPYERQARETAMLIAREASLRDDEWVFAFQSQGKSGGPWIGPTVEETIDALAQQGDKEVIVQPVGFVCDHVEVLYDIDIAFKEYAAQLGITLTRTESLNDSPEFIAALADLALAHLKRVAIA
jgi:ferrochelatase